MPVMERSRWLFMIPWVIHDLFQYKWRVEEIMLPDVLTHLKTRDLTESKFVLLNKMFRKVHLMLTLYQVILLVKSLQDSRPTDIFYSNYFQNQLPN